MVGSHAELFDSIREDVLTRLVEVRGSIDHAYATVAEDVIREQFCVVLDKMRSYLVTQNPDLYRSFATRWLAMRTGQGFAPENIIHSMVALGNVVSDVAKARFGPTPEYFSFARAMAHLNFVATRMLVELLAEEVKRRSEQHNMLSRKAPAQKTLMEFGK